MNALDFWSMLRITVNVVYILALMFTMSNFKCGWRTVRVAYAAVLACAACFNIRGYICCSAGNG